MRSSSQLRDSGFSLRLCLEKSPTSATLSQLQSLNSNLAVWLASVFKHETLGDGRLCAGCQISTDRDIAAIHRDHVISIWEQWPDKPKGQPFRGYEEVRRT